MTATRTSRRRFRCRVGMHKFVLKVSDDARYHECQYCGKYDDNTNSGNGPGGLSPF